MAEKLLTGASFKAPDWKGPASAATNSASAALATLPVGQADAEMEDADASPASPVAASEAVSTAAQLPAAGLAVGAADSDTDMIGTPPARFAAQSGADEDQLQAVHHPDAVQPPPSSVLPYVRHMAIIRQPGWQQASPQPAPQSELPRQQSAQPQQPQPPVLHQHPSVVTPKTHVNDLPDDVLQHIFSMLPFRKRCACARTLTAYGNASFMAYVINRANRW